MIGLDAAELALIQRWSREGFLPHISTLMDNGTWGRLISTAEVLSGSVWPSLVTGTLPGKHGRYYRLQPRPGRQVIAPNTEPYRQKPFWSHLAAAGYRCLIVDVPFSVPLGNFAGIQIIDWGTSDKFLNPQSTPAETLRKIIRRWGHHPLERPLREPYREKHFPRLLRELLAGISIKGQAVKDLLANQLWDFCFVVFSETHIAGHYFWDSSHAVAPEPRQSPNVTTTLDPLMQTYVAIDQVVGQILRVLHQDTTVLLVSGHGMDVNPSGSHLLPEVLRRKGLMACYPDGMASDKIRHGDWLKMVRDLIPLTSRRFFSRKLTRGLNYYLSSRWASADIDWERTKAYCLPTDHQGYVRVNLKGREPQGIVEPGKEYDDICKEISHAVSQLVNPVNGRRAIQRVFKTDEVFPGRYRDHLPDLVVSWTKLGGINELYSDEIGYINKENRDLRSGNHSPIGFITLAGAAHDSGRFPGSHICDVAPTILSLFNIPAVENFDGRAMTVPTGL